MLASPTQASLIVWERLMFRGEIWTCHLGPQDPISRACWPMLSVTFPM